MLEVRSSVVITAWQESLNQTTMSRLVLLTLSLQALCAWAFVPTTSRWCRSAVIRSADVLEFGGDDDKPKEMTADEKQEMLYCIGLNVATQVGDGRMVRKFVARVCFQHTVTLRCTRRDRSAPALAR